MSNTANVVFLLGYVQNEQALAKNKISQANYGEKRAFYSGNKDMDYLRYIEKGSTEPLPGFDYISYSGDDEKSSGVFNKDGLLGKSTKKELRSDLRATKSVIWHGIISFEEDFGNRYVNGYDEAYRLLKIEFPRFLKSAGFDPNKIEWFAGLHENTKHKHIHYSFYEKEPSRCSERSHGKPVFSHGKINPRLFELFKVRIEQRLTDISSEIKASRKDLTDITRNLLFSKESKIRYQTDIQEQLNELLTALPKDGRLSYDSENMKPLQPQIKKIIDSLIKTNKPLYNQFISFCKQIKQKDTTTLNILKSNKIKENEWAKYLVADKYLDDLYRRLGNQVINSVRTIKAKEKQTRSRLANKRIRRRSLQRLIEYSIKLNTDFETEAIYTFEEFLRKLEDKKNNELEEINEME